MYPLGRICVLRVNIALSSYVNCNLLLLGDILIYHRSQSLVDWLRERLKELKIKSISL